MKALFQNTLLFLIILILVSCKAIELRPNATPSSSPDNISNNPPRIISFDAEPPFVTEGNAYTLSWKTNNTTDVHISGIGRVSPSGHHTVSSSTPDKGDIILTASNNAGFPPVTKHLPMQMVMFSTKAPPGVPLNKPVFILADQNMIRHYKRTYQFQPINRAPGFVTLQPATPQIRPRPVGVVRALPLQPARTAAPIVHDHRSKPIVRDHRSKPIVHDHRSKPVIRDHRSVLSAPQLISPANQSRFSHYPRNLTLRWKAIANAKSYTVEIDCLNCCARGKWCSDIGKTFKRIPSLTSTQYKFQFVGAQAGRWRVQAVDRNGKAGKQSQWSNFRFTR